MQSGQMFGGAGEAAAFAARVRERVSAGLQFYPTGASLWHVDPSVCGRYRFSLLPACHACRKGRSACRIADGSCGLPVHGAGHHQECTLMRTLSRRNWIRRGFQAAPRGAIAAPVAALASGARGEEAAPAGTSEAIAQYASRCPTDTTDCSGANPARLRRFHNSGALPVTDRVLWLTSVRSLVPPGNVPHR